MDSCAESGWYGYDIHISKPVNETLIASLGILGRMNCICTLKRPFFIVRGEGFLVRGIAGDDFIRAGSSDKAARS